VPNGDSLEDECGICDNNPSNNCEQDCAGEWGGSLENDECGICGGDDSSCEDCNGIPNGSAILDECGICDADTSNDCEQDCAGEWGGDAEEDECGVCGGDDSSCEDCNEDVNGEAYIDNCGNCVDFGIDANAGKDDCGVCGGNSDTCLDCAGTVNGTAVLDCFGECGGNAEIDACDVCGGDCFTGNYSLLFDGTDDKVIIPQQSIPFHSGIYTISIWIKITTTDTIYTVAGTDWATDGTWAIRMNCDSNNNHEAGKILYWKRDSGYYGGTLLQSNIGDININTWHHVMITCDSSIATLYIDGVSVATDDDIGSDIVGYDIKLGDKLSPSSNDFLGYIDEFAIFDEDKSSKIADMYNFRIPTDLSVESGLKGYWRMNEGIGNITMISIST
jgi:hypothetical protein